MYHQGTVMACKFKIYTPLRDYSITTCKSSKPKSSCICIEFPSVAPVNDTCSRINAIPNALDPPYRFFQHVPVRFRITFQFISQSKPFRVLSFQPKPHQLCQLINSFLLLSAFATCICLLDHNVMRLIHSV